MKRWLPATALLVATACDAPSPPPPPPAPLPLSAAPLDSGTIARVGDAPIRSNEVARIAAAQSISVKEARDLAVHDALFAEEARARGVTADPQVNAAESGVLARALMQQITAEAEARGPVTDEELDAVTATHWTELDRPDAARVVHAVVMLPKGAPAERRAAATALADAIRKSVGPAIDEAHRTSPPPPEKRGVEDPVVAIFKRAIADVPKNDLEVRVEPLSPVVADGRTLDGQSYDTTFAKAALDLSKRGDVSPVTETPFGFHVMLLLERVPGQTSPREERRAMVREEVMSTRARAAKDKLLEQLHHPGAVAIDRSVDAALALVPVDR
ncbi:MAG: peptidyl-prolyl cis-trans isomerase [Polyangiaceae bacterium]